MIEIVNEQDDLLHELLLANKCKEIADSDECVDISFCDTFDCFACPNAGDDGCLGGPQKMRKLRAKAWLYDYFVRRGLGDFSV